jgi:hypothetical protein
MTSSPNPKHEHRPPTPIFPHHPQYNLQRFPTTGNHQQLNWTSSFYEKSVNEGTWETRKEILGWLFDGIARTIELPESKGRTIRTETKQLISAAIAILCGKPLLGPLDKAIATAGRKNIQHITITDNVWLCLQDWIALIRQLGQRPTHVKELVLHAAAYQDFVDASKRGVSGVWFRGTKHLSLIVWFWEWPKEVQDNLVSSTNRSGLLNIPNTN